MIERMLLNCGVSLSKDNPYCLNFCLVDKMPLVARILKNKLLFLQVTTVEFSVRTPSFGRSGVRAFGGSNSVFCGPVSCTHCALLFFCCIWEEIPPLCYGNKKLTSSVVFIAARISYIRFFTAVLIYDFYISTTIKPLILHVSPHPPHPCVNSDWFRHCCVNSTTNWGGVEWRAGRLD